MAVADLGACEWFVMELRRSGLIDRGQLEQVVGDFLKKHPRSEPQSLGDFLVKQNILTKFQAERILGGKSQGLVLGPYTLLDSIGSGSMGTVYKAVSKNDAQNYAVKVLPRRSMWNVRLARRQVRAFASFNHPSVVPFVDVGTAGGLHYLAWPMVEGETLEKEVGRDGKMPSPVAGLVALQLAQGLASAQQNGLFHGLIKPSNILIGPDNVARLLDFGIGSLLVENEGESLVDTMSTANTLTSGLDCASPESIMEPTNRTPAGDQYSLGCVLYFCLTGQYPFPEGSAVEKMMAHQTKEPKAIKEINPEVPQGLIDIVSRLMAKDPAARYAVMDEVAEALQPFAAEPPRVPSVLTSGSYMETPRPLGATGGVPNRSIGAQALRQAVQGRGAPAAKQPAAPAATPPTTASSATHSLPPGVRSPAKSKSGIGTIPSSVPNYSVAPTLERPASYSIGPLTLVLGGMAIMCTAYIALSYFQLVK